LGSAEANIVVTGHDDYYRYDGSMLGWMGGPIDHQYAWDSEYYFVQMGSFYFSSHIVGHHLDGGWVDFTNCVYPNDCNCPPRNPYCEGQFTLLCCVPEAHETTRANDNYQTQLTFIKHWPTDEEQTAILHLDESEYRTENGWGSDPAKVAFWGKPGIACSVTEWGSTNIGFVVKIKTNTRYTIGNSDFTVPSYIDTDDFAWPNAQSRYTGSESGRYLYFSSLANGLVTLKSDPPSKLGICAKSGWPDQEVATRTATITVSMTPSEDADKLKDRIVLEIKELKGNPQYTPDRHRGADTRCDG
jgi:hypothetical protein